MEDTTPTFKTALRELLEEETRRSCHLEPQELTGYHAGELAPAERAAVRRHLASCRECASLLLDLQSFPEGMTQGETLSEDDVTAAWEKFQARLARDEAASRASRPPAEDSVRARVARGQRLAYPLAAALAVLALSLGLWNVTLRQNLAQLSKPQVNTPVIDLIPERSLRFPQEEVQEVEFPPGSHTAVLILHLSEVEYPAYQVEIVDATRQTTITPLSGLDPEPGSLTLTIFRPSLPPGPYRFVLYGLRGVARDLVEEYRVRVVHR